MMAVFGMNLDNLVLLGIAGFQLVNTILVVKQTTVARKNAVTLVETQAMVKQTELNTNSMKDALVKATGEASHAAGMQEATETNRAIEAARQSGMREAQRPAPVSPLGAVQPLPVQDDRTAKAAEKTAAAVQKSAVATERLADATEASTELAKKT